MINSDFSLSLHVLLHLATNEEEGELLTSARLAELMHVHPVQIRRVLAKMKCEGYIDSKEGSRGGFSISCDLDRVSLKDIYLLTQEDLLKPKCNECCSSCKIGHNIEKVLDSIITEVDGKFQENLEKYTLSKVLEML